MSEHFEVSLSRWQNFQFLVDFEQPGVQDLLTDETEPLGEGRGPNPARLLAAAVGNCLAASLLFCLKKSHVDVDDINCVVQGEMSRNERGRLRIDQLNVRIEPSVSAENLERMARCGTLFEDFCIVTESVRSGINVVVDLAPVAIEEPAAV